ncbi:hypothetical protein AUL39_06930 [Tractidigestivibacter scatoligenes]|uniref:Uncharacterized protein n=1 Tax=Tractidigestivibacter scatoligenes TaxID=1299998 RepID=A0A117J4N8_TRASO|nr:helix-turn-helix transcriptional regulator [Tractidigestivibacter scatoligenes]KUH58693.1 hypothetical protein AUL39_06930 [Tractidigestivibacter scatoligenes]
MDAKTAIQWMVISSGKTPSELASSIGKGRTYVYTVLNQESVPRLDTFARLARACGYRLVLETEDGSRGVELYTEVDERGEESTPVEDLAYDLAEKSIGDEAMENLPIDLREHLVSTFAPSALDSIRRREAMFFEDGDHREDACDTITTDMFSPGW